MPEGRRVDGSFPEQPGDYGLFGGVWWAKVPAVGFPSARLDLHTVTEHSDGTVTASPSILMELGDGRRWHGYLERGVWRALGDCVLDAPEEQQHA